MGDLFEDPEKVGKAVDQGKGENKKQCSLLRFHRGKDQGQEKDWYKRQLEGNDERHVFHVKEVEEESGKCTQNPKKYPRIFR